MKKLDIVYILLGIGIGIILTSIVFYLNPLIEHKDYTDEEIKEKAKELGMVSITDALKDNKTDTKSPIEESSVIKFKISTGDTLTDTTDNLYDLGIIEDKEEFIKFARDRKLDKKLIPGIYELKPNLSY